MSQIEEDTGSMWKGPHHKPTAARCCLLVCLTLPPSHRCPASMSPSCPHPRQPGARDSPTVPPAKCQAWCLSHACKNTW